MLAITGDTAGALAEFREVRRLYADAYGPRSAHVARLDRQISRLQGIR